MVSARATRDVADEIAASPEERPQLQHLAQWLAALGGPGGGRLSLLGPHGEQSELPSTAVLGLHRLVQLLAGGATVLVSPEDAEVTTQEAADLLNVSRTYLVRLLDEGKLPHRRLNSHRRVSLRAVLDYKRERATRTSAALGELAALSQELGLYDADAEATILRR